MSRYDYGGSLAAMLGLVINMVASWTGCYHYGGKLDRMLSLWWQVGWHASHVIFLAGYSGRVAGILDTPFWNYRHMKKKKEKKEEK